MVAVRPIAPMSTRAFEVLHGGEIIGFLGEELGPFESAEKTTEPGPPACRYRSLDSDSETAILELLHTTTRFDGLLDILARSGLELRPTESEGLFVGSAVVLRIVVD